jgi:hypothetical protein
MALVILIPGPSVYNLVATNNPQEAGRCFCEQTRQKWKFHLGRQFAGSFDEIGFGLAIDPSGNIIITGEFAGDTDFDPGPGNFILQIPKHGNTRFSLSN